MDEKDDLIIDDFFKPIRELAEEAGFPKKDPDEKQEAEKNRRNTVQQESIEA